MGETNLHILYAVDIFNKTITYRHASQEWVYVTCLSLAIGKLRH